MDSRLWVRACAISIAVCASVFTWLVTDESLNLFRSSPFSNFYDIQARALLHGHWNVSPSVLWIEGIRTNGLTYEYYGPVPALLRIPVLLFTSRLDGRLTELSLLVAFVVALVFVSRLSWKVRLLLRGAQEVSWGEASLAAVWTAVIGLGSVLIFLASSIQVYYEAELWGAALALGAFDAILTFVMRPSRWKIVIACGLATLAIMTRGSVGAGPVATLGLLAVGHGALALWRRYGGGRPGVGRVFDWIGISRESGSRTWFVGLAVAAAVPIICYAVVNEIKFHSLFSLPLNRQLYTQLNAHRRAVLASNHGSYFSLKYIPTAVLAYLRPDALRFTRLFPFVAFPAGPVPVVGHVLYDTRDWTSSAVATMPALMVTIVVGLVAMVRRSTRAAVAGLRLVVVGGALGTIGVLTIAYIANRYLADAMPLVVVLSLVGFYVGWNWWRRCARPLRIVVTSVMTGLALFAVWVNASLAVIYQRELEPNILVTSRTQLVSLQARLDNALFGGSAPPVSTGSALPLSAPAGALAIVGSCEGLYQFNGHQWFGVQIGARGGGIDLQMTFAGGHSGRRQPVVVVGHLGHGEILAVSDLAGDRVRFSYRYWGAGQPWWDGVTFKVVPGRAYHVALALDPRVEQVTAVVDGATELNLYTTNYFLYPVAEPTHVELGAGPSIAGSSTRFDGTIVRQKVTTPLCNSLLERSR